MEESEMDHNSSTESAGVPHDPATMEVLWTVDEVARYFRVKPQTIRAMTRRGLLKGVKVGRGWRFKLSEIQNVMSEQN